MDSIIEGNISNYEDNSLQSIIPVSYEVPINSINDLSIIINDQECSDSFFEAVCTHLKEKGINYNISHLGKEINVDNSVVITLDMQYCGGDHTMIFAPFDNARLGQSDSLSLAMYASFLQNGFTIKELSNGKIGFRGNDEDNKRGIIPTKTEEIINPSFLTSFVTISFGTGASNPSIVADSIINGLARFKYYLDYCDLNTDLVYRSSPNDKVAVAAKYFGVSDRDLVSYNHLEDFYTLNGDVIINPLVGTQDAFNPNNSFTINYELEYGYKK